MPKIQLTLLDLKNYTKFCYNMYFEVTILCYNLQSQFGKTNGQKMRPTKKSKQKYNGTFTAPLTDVEEKQQEWKQR